MGNLLVEISAFDFGALFANFLSEWYYYLALLCFIGIVVIFAFAKRAERNDLTPTQKIVYGAIFTALCAVANILTFKVSDLFQVSFIATIGFLSGYLLGAGWGFAAAFIGDLIGMIIAPLGIYNPIISIGTALWGFIPGLIFDMFKGNHYVKTIISFAICFILNTCIINTIGLSLMYSIPFDKLLYTLPLKLIPIVVNCALSLLLVRLMPRILPKNKFYIS